MSSRLCVVGAIHMDLVITTPRFPRAGERLVADAFVHCAGGKGANQAVAAARLGAKVDLVGCVGDDGWGGDLRSALVAEGVDVHHVSARPETPTGVGVVGVLPDSQLGVIVAPGADLKFDAEDVESARLAIEGAALLVMQLEYPEAALVRALEIARAKGVPVLLNASPAKEVPRELIEGVDVLVVDKSESPLLLGSDEELGSAGIARRLGALGPKRVVVTQQGRDAVLFDGERVHESASFDVDSIDSTGCRDAFTGALAVAFLEENRLEKALRSACAAGALASTRRGALPSLPTHDEHVAFLSSPG